MEKNTSSRVGPLRHILCILFFAAALAAALGAITSSRAVSQPTSPEQTAALRKIAPWVTEHTAEGKQAELMVVLTDQADLSGATLVKTKKEKGRFVRDALWNKSQVTQGPLLNWLAERKLEYRSFYIVNAIWVKGRYDDVMALALRPDVARVEGNPQIKNSLPQPGPTLEEPLQSDTPATIEPGISYTHAPEVWAQGFTGQNIVVGSADTGVRWTHNALKPQYRGWNGVTADHNYNWHDSIHSGGGTCGPNSLFPCDDFFHGSHTTGTAIGSDGGTNQIGMAPGAKWIACRNMDQGIGTPARYIECMEFFLAPYPVSGGQGDPTKAPDITINSWSCPTSEGCSANTLQAAVDAQAAAGIMMVSAAQNSGPNCSTVTDPPGIYASTYSVGALNTSTDTIASFSSRGPVTTDGSNRTKPDITAPGTNTRSASNSSDSAYTVASGTSMATPHIAGAMALLWSAIPSLQNQIDLSRAALNDTAQFISSTQCGVAGPPNNVFGWGRVNILAAVDAQSVLSLTSAASRLTHGSAGSFDIGMPLAGPSGVEDRSTGGSYTAVFIFDAPVTSGSVSVMSGTATVGAITFSGNEMRAALTGVADAQIVVLHTQNINGDGQPHGDVPFGFLLGDINGNGVVDKPDNNSLNANKHQPVTGANFRNDLNLSGVVDPPDQTLLKANKGHHL